MSDTNDISKKVKEYRLSHLWTLQQMGRVVGLSASAVHKIEAGKVRPHELTIAKIQRALPDFQT